MYSINLVSPEWSYKEGGTEEERKKLPAQAAAQPMLDCRYQHSPLYQQSCAERAINLPGGALWGRLTMQVQSQGVIWRHPEQLKIHSSLQEESKREISLSFQCKGAGGEGRKQSIIKNHTGHLAWGNPTCTYVSK